MITQVATQDKARGMAQDETPEMVDRGHLREGAREMREAREVRGVRVDLGNIEFL